MKDMRSDFAFDLADLDRAGWLEAVDEIAEDHGYAEPVGPDYTALFIDANTTLLVSFEAVATVRAQNDGKAPMGWGFVRDHGWSSLTFLSNEDPDWFRHPAMIGTFDRLIDDGFFDDFDQILFYGQGAAGYAAAAFSVAAPEANVLVIQPQATLARDIASWDRRFAQTRRLDFTSRFGYAPMMVETADSVAVIFDPNITEDAVHASLFSGPNTARFETPYLGPNAARDLASMDILQDMIELAMEGTLTARAFASLWRERQSHAPYLRSLVQKLDKQPQHRQLLAQLCRHVAAQGNRPFFAKKLAELEAEGTSPDR